MSLRGMIFGLALVACPSMGCGDDADPAEDTGASTTGTTGAVTTTDPSGSTDAATDGASTGSTGPDSTSTAADTGSSGAGSGEDSSGSGDTGATGDTGDTGDTDGTEDTAGESTTGDGEYEVPGCGTCPNGTICLANEAFQTEYECVPLPRECNGEIDCECGEQLCEAPFVACFDPPDEPNSLSCICIAC